MQKNLGKYSLGVGDRFGMEGEAQLKAIIEAQKHSVAVTPVWNKSNREHLTVKSDPNSVRKEADAAVEVLNFKGDYFVDADHINLENVDRFIPCSDFFTIDIAKFIGTKASEKSIAAFTKFVKKYIPRLNIPGLADDLTVSEHQFEKIVETFLLATEHAGKIFEHISKNKQHSFVTEVSIDEVAHPQSPLELFFILAALAFYSVPVNTIAPKFTGNFNKGVDYEGNIEQFAKEFEADIFVIKYVIKEFGLPENLKLSVHSGSDKFSIYPIINQLIKKHDVGLHVKTAGTTWLEELIGLAESEGEAFELSCTIYESALERYEELTQPYDTVLSIDKSLLPSPDFLRKRNGARFASLLRHSPQDPNYNMHFRQLMHCAYKIAAEKDSFLPMLEKHRDKIAQNVTHNLLERHLKPLFFS